MTDKKRTSAETPAVGEGPVLFIGTPTSCRASIPLHNPSNRKLKLKELAIRAPELEPRTGALFPRIKARLEPHQSAALPVRLPLDRSTPPGVYGGTLEVGGKETETEIHVLEHPSARVSPPRLGLRGRCGDESRHTLVLENTGNVAFEVASATRVSIEQEHWAGRAAVVSLRSFEGSSFDALMDSVARELTASLPAPVEIRIDDGGDGELQPGDRRRLELRVTLPEDLQLGRTYRGGLELGPTRLGITIECTGQVPVRKGSDRKTPKRGTAKKGKTAASRSQISKGKKKSGQRSKP